MQLQNFYAQDANGNIVPGATCSLYLPGTTTLASGLEDVNGSPLANPFAANDDGLAQVAAPNGKYDLKIESGLITSTLPVVFADTLQALQQLGGFLPPSATAPVAREDGTPLQPGDNYFNTVDGVQYIYVYSVWTPNNVNGADLANDTDPAKGASLVGIEGETVSDQILLNKKLRSYQDIRDYEGQSLAVTVKIKRLQGTFYRRDRILGDVDNNGTVLLSTNGLWTWERDYVGAVWTNWFGSKGDLVTDDSPFINAAFDSIAAPSGPDLYGSGGTVSIPSAKKARSLIKSPVRVKFGCTFEGAGSDLYNTNLYVAPDFVGEAAIIMRGDGFSYTNGHIKSVGVSCNNVPGVGGVLMAGAYNNSSFEDSFVIDVHGGSIPLEIRPMTTAESPTPVTVCESVLLKDLYILHYEAPASVTQPTIKLSKTQESTLINVKAFSSRNNSGSGATDQSAMVFDDCRGITVIGGAAVGCKYGITISATTRFAAGFKIIGFTHELVTDFGLRLIGNASFQVSGVEYDLPRYEAPQPTSGLYAEYAVNCRIDTGIKGATLGLGVTGGMEIQHFGVGVITADASARYEFSVTPNAVTNRRIIGASQGVDIMMGSLLGFTARNSGGVPVIGFYGNAPVVKPTVSGSWSGGTAGPSLASALASLGLITNSTTA